jgi:hypothetical protein
MYAQQARTMKSKLVIMCFVSDTNMICDKREMVTSSIMPCLSPWRQMEGVSQMTIDKKFQVCHADAIEQQPMGNLPSPTLPSFAAPANRASSEDGALFS